MTFLYEIICFSKQNKKNVFFLGFLIWSLIFFFFFFSVNFCFLKYFEEIFLMFCIITFFFVDFFFYYFFIFIYNLYVKNKSSKFVSVYKRNLEPRYVLRKVGNYLVATLG